MKAIIIKELRENVRWAALLMIALSLILTWAMKDALQMSQTAFASWSIYYATIAGFPGAALILGLLQSLQDQWRGRGAFVMHRPVAAASIFWAKVLTGLSLYLLITAIPLMTMIAWAAVPGNVPAPFDWHMALPCFWDLINGVGWYFTGILIGCRPARWLGSRTMPLGAVLLCTYFGIDLSPNLTDSLLATAGALLVVIPAARGSFINGGTFERQPAIVRACQTIAVTLGLGFILLIGSEGLREFLRSLITQPVTQYTYWTYRIDTAARVVRSETENGRVTRDTDPSGNPLEPAPPGRTARVGVDFAQLSPLRMIFEGRYGDRRRFHSPWQYIQAIYSEPEHISWYYVVGRRTIEGYDQRTRLRTGSVGPSGFAPLERTPEAFPLQFEYVAFINPTWMKLLHDGIHLYQIDFGGRKEIKQILTTSADDPIVDMSALNLQDEYRIALTEKSFRVALDGKEILHVPLKLDAQTIQVARQEDGSFTLLCSPGGTWRAESRYRVITISADGQTIGQTELPPLPEGKFVGPVVSQTYWDRFLQGIHYPPVYVLFMMVNYRIRYGAALFRMVYFEPTLILSIAAISGGLAFWVTRRYASGRSSQIVWTCFAAVTGLPGLAALLAMRNWPARIKCPSCGKLRVVTHDSCEHCSATFSPPHLQGIEIFE